MSSIRASRPPAPSTRFLLNFHGKLTADMYTQADNLGISLHQAVIVASMIEAEAANDDERANIASVIYNRLNQASMPLQIDATVMYALGEHKEHLTEEDLKVESPYNTYTNTGLPAGPICNPGLASINAALNPAEHELPLLRPRHRDRHAPASSPVTASSRPSRRRRTTPATEQKNNRVRPVPHPVILSGFAPIRACFPRLRRI